MNLNKLVLALLLYASAISIAQPAAVKATWETYTFPDGQGALSISDKPCSVPVAMEKWEAIRADVQARHNTDIGEIKQSRLLWHGRVYAGCYAIGPDNNRVYNIDSTGEKLSPPLPREAFVPHEGALPVGGTKI